jgi:hypothetical protein
MKRPTLHFRLLTAIGSSLAISTQQQQLNAELFAAAYDLVLTSMRRMHPELDPAPGQTPEIISQQTIDHLEQLESLLGYMRNLMNDSNVPQDGAWGEAIDAADKLLGFELP